MPFPAPLLGVAPPPAPQDLGDLQQKDCSPPSLDTAHSPSSVWGAAGCCGKLGLRPGRPALALLCARQSSGPFGLHSYFQRQLGDKMRNKAARWREEWQAPLSLLLLLHPAFHISPAPPLLPEASVPNRAAEPASGHARSQVPLSCPRCQPAPHLASRHPRQVLPALRACLFLPGED